MLFITWEDFNRPLADGDVIRLTEAAGPGAGSIEVVLELGPRVTWGKEVKAITRDRATIARVTRSGRYRGPLAFTVPVGHVAYFVFSKARFLGRRTEMYAVGNAAEKDGRQLTFSWESD